MRSGSGPYSGAAGTSSTRAGGWTFASTGSCTSCGTGGTSRGATRTGRAASLGSRLSKEGAAGYGTAPFGTTRCGSHRCHLYSGAAFCTCSCGSATNTCGDRGGRGASHGTKECLWTKGWTTSRSAPMARTRYSGSRTSGGRGRRYEYRTGTCTGTASNSRRLISRTDSAYTASSTSTTFSCGAGPMAHMAARCSLSSFGGCSSSRDSSRTRVGRGREDGTEACASSSPS